jgi:GrpB-like predicted nucleotidyltransferase (UPF0157 family)
VQALYIAADLDRCPPARRTVAFRDYLRNQADLAREYDALKRGLALHHGGADVRSGQA